LKLFPPAAGSLRWSALCFTLLGLLLFMAVGSPAVHGARVALLLLADLSLEDNGINEEITDELGQALTDRGINLVSKADVRAFMVSNHLRHAGYLDSFTARKIGRELDCLLVLTGSVTEKDHNHGTCFGLLLSAMDTGSGNLLWTTNQASSLAAQVTFLGIGEPKSLADLQSLLINKVAADFCLRQPFLAKEPATGQPFAITDLRLIPKYVRGGKNIACALRIDFLERPADRVELCCNNTKVRLHREPQNNPYYTGRWRAPAEDGSYPLSLTLTWNPVPPQEKETTCVTEELAAYQVSNRPPRLNLMLKRGHHIGNLTIFNRELLILPHIDKILPLSRWRVEIRNQDGIVVVSEERQGEIPRLLWKGCNNHKQRLKDGVYDFVLQIWDVAENKAEVSKKLSLQTACRPVNVKSSQQKGKTFVILTAAGGESTAPHSWEISLSTPDGREFFSQSGASLPAKLELPPVIKDDFLLYELEARDRLGNRFAIQATRLYMPCSTMTVAQGKQQHFWSEDF